MFCTGEARIFYLRNQHDIWWGWATCSPILGLLPVLFRHYLVNIPYAYLSVQPRGSPGPQVHVMIIVPLALAVAVNFELLRLIACVLCSAAHLFMCLRFWVAPCCAESSYIELSAGVAGGGRVEFVTHSRVRRPTRPPSSWPRQLY